MLGREQKLWVSPSYQHWCWALCFHLSLNRILALQRGLDHQLLLDTSTTCPVFISLHSRLKMQVRQSATWTAASPWLWKARACQWSEGGKEAGFPGTSGQPRRLGLQSPPGWEGMPARAGLQGCYYCMEDGRFPLTGQRKTNPELYNTQCTASPIKTGLIVSAPHGAGQTHPNQNSAVFKRKPVTV